MRRIDFAIGMIGAALVALVAGTAVAAPGTNLRASRDAAWGKPQAAHLLRRAGFGGTPDQITYLTMLGRDAAVAYLVDFHEIPLNDAPYSHRDDDTRPLERRLLTDLDQDERSRIMNMVRNLHNQRMEAVREWWIRRMVVTSRPLEERMTLFWHGHFTSGFREVRNWHLMYEQNELFRRHALGNFGDLLAEISRDGAMLLYLDNARNVKSHPNENYARELMELFTLGEGNYSERDIREVARAFTGWGLELGQFRFYPKRHDDGRKTVFGKQGDFDGDDIHRLILRKPACSRHLARCLWEYFAYPDPDPGLVDALAAVIRKNEYRLREPMRALLRSDAFYSERAMLTRVKSPVDLTIGSVRMLGIEAVNPSGLYLACRNMGQNLFQPPNVKGWDGDRRWITTSTLFARYNFAADLLGIRGRGTRKQASDRDRMRPNLAEISVRTVGIAPYDPDPVIRSFQVSTPEEIVRHYVDRLLQRELPPDRFETVLRAFSPEENPFRIDASDAAHRIRELVRLVMSMPEYQLG